MAPLTVIVGLWASPRGAWAILAFAAVAGVLGELCGRISSHFSIKARRLEAIDAETLLRSDPRPPVVYFRPFGADSETTRKVPLTRWHTHEEQFEKAMSDIGPFVAIGQPSDGLRPAGAARVYVGDEAWQAQARRLIECAGLIVLRVGDGPGLWFELETAVAARPLQRLLLLVPHDRSGYEAFRQRAQTLLPTLPELDPWTRVSRARAGLRAIISFDAKGELRCIDVPDFRVPLLKRCPMTPLVPMLRLALEPLYRDLGLRWSPPRNNGHTMLLLACAVCLVFAVLGIAVDFAIDGPAPWLN